MSRIQLPMKKKLKNFIFVFKIPSLPTMESKFNIFYNGQGMTLGNPHHAKVVSNLLGYKPCVWKPSLSKAEMRMVILPSFFF